MNETFFGVTNKRYTSQHPRLAFGGEGEIFNVVEDASLVIKIYTQPTRDREKKLRYMLDHPPASKLLTQIAWPIDVIYNQSKKFIGFVMNRIISNENLNEVYAIGRGAKYKNFDWSKKLIIAKNLCSVVYGVHQAGHVIGDFNPKNIGVNVKTLKVALMDTDSYHIQTGTETYRCGVGRPDYLPAEIQAKMSNGNDLSSANLPTFSKQSDYFALAIHIFQLLMNSAHPYSLRVKTQKDSVVKPDLEDGILNGQTAYFNLPAGMSYPAYSPPVVFLPQFIQDLMIRAFITGTKNPSLRPSEEEWHDALSQLQKNTTQCSKLSHHQYPKNNPSCPWCRVNQEVNSVTRTAVQGNKTAIKAPPPIPSSAYTPPRYSKVRPTPARNLLGDFLTVFLLFLAGSGILMLGFGIFELIVSGWSGFFPGIGNGFMVIVSMFVFLWDVIVWIVSALGFILGFLWDVIVWLWNALIFIILVLWDVFVWILNFTMNTFLPFIWDLIVWLWNGFFWLLGFLFNDVIPFLWMIVVWLWDSLWFLLGVAWDLVVWVVSGIGWILENTIRFIGSFF